MITLLFAASLVFSPEILDQEMTAQERKLTGVSKLSNPEKAALQRWIDARYDKKNNPTPQNIEGKHPTLSENLQSGHYIRLSDNSLWQVRPQDVPIAQGWITPVEIVISQSGDAQYPTKLTNSVTGSSILAKKADAPPAQTLQPPTPVKK